MPRQLFNIVGLVVAALTGLANASCSAPAGHEPATNAETGEVAIPLTATSDDVAYRLSSARFTIKALAGNVPSLNVVAPPDEAVHHELLPTGVYSVTLESGWQLESKGASTTGPYTAINAALVSSNPLTVRISRGVVVDALFRFATNGPVVDFGRGGVKIRIDVDECAGYDGYTSALGTFTVACLGTIGPDSYRLDQAGLLQRNFDKCPLDEGKLRSIDDYLSLQRRKELLPLGQRCIAGRWAAWKKAFDTSGITQCPTWALQRRINEPTIERVASVLKQLDVLPPEGGRERTPPTFLSLIKIGAVFETAWANGMPEQACATPGACAARCAGGFPAFVTDVVDSVVVTDPWDWDLDTNYNELMVQNPFVQLGYYHAMSYVDPDPDGVIVGHRSRDKEPCSRYEEPFTYPATRSERGEGRGAR